MLYKCTQGFEIDDQKQRLQIHQIHQFLSEKAYWCLGIPLDVVKNAIENSLCFGVYSSDNVQVGFARVVSDKSTFAWLCDVYILDAYQKKGLAQSLIKAVMEHPELQKLRRICLATRDAHGLYEKLGFEVTKTPQNWMEIKNNNIYKES